MGKSYWTITTAEEVAIFSAAHTNNWQGKDGKWGLHLPNQVISYLGVAQDHIRKVFIARFVCNTGQNTMWHGYPADPESNTQDIPPEQILSEWNTLGYIKPKQMRLLIRGQRCDL